MQTEFTSFSEMQNYLHDNPEARKVVLHLTTHHLDDGTKCQEVPLLDMQVHGVMKTFHRNGQVHDAKTYENGWEHGSHIVYDENGVVLFQEFWSKGEMISFEWKKDKP